MTRPSLPQVTPPAASVVELALAPAGLLDLPPTGRGALDGVRVAVKDVFDVAGTVTAAGNPTLAAGPVACQDAAAVARIRRAGGRVVAKAATDELAMGMFGVNSHFGTPLNPACPERVPGGSSSGPASLVACGAADLGLGSDTGGSVRVPAAFCGLWGLRPSFGRIDVTGLRPMAPRFDTVGLLGRDLALVATAFGVLAPDAERRTGRAASDRPVRELIVLEDLLEHATDALAARTFEATGSLVARAGLPLRGLRWPARFRTEVLVECFWTLMSRDLWGSQSGWVQQARPVLGTGIAERIAAAAEVTDAEVREARSLRTSFQRWMAAELAAGIAILPTTWALPPLRGTDHVELMAWRDRNLAHTVIAPLLAGPQLAVPAGRLDDDLGSAPASWSLLGLPGDDGLLIDLARLADPTPEGNGTREGTGA